MGAEFILTAVAREVLLRLSDKQRKRLVHAIIRAVQSEGTATSGIPDAELRTTKFIVAGVTHAIAYRWMVKEACHIYFIDRQ